MLDEAMPHGIARHSLWHAPRQVRSRVGGHLKSIFKMSANNVVVLPNGGDTRPSWSWSISCSAGGQETFMEAIHSGDVDVESGCNSSWAHPGLQMANSSIYVFET